MIGDDNLIMVWPDQLRALCVVLSLALSPMSMFAVARSTTLHQRYRFISTALLGAVVVAWEIEAWGRPFHWRVPVLTTSLLFAVIGVGMFLRARRLEDAAEERELRKPLEG